jgi:hypothetical protein
MDEAVICPDGKEVDEGRSCHYQMGTTVAELLRRSV